MHLRRSILGIYMLLFILGYYGWLHHWQDDESMKTLGGNIFSALAPFFASCILFYVYTKYRKDGRKFWGFMGLGCFAFFIAEIVWMYYENLLQVEVPFPGIPDLFYTLQITFYMAAFLTKLYEKKESFRFIRFLFDILIVMSVAMVFSWNYIISVIVSKTDVTMAELVVSLISPLGDLVLLFGVISLYVGSKDIFSPKVLFFIVFSLLIQISADSTYLYLTSMDLYESGGLYDPLWSLALLTMAQAGLRDLHTPSIEQKSQFHVVDQLDPLRLLLPYVSVAVLFVFMIFHKENLHSFDIGFGFTILLLVVRQIFTILENRSLLLNLQQLTEDLEEKVRLRTEELAVTNSELSKSLQITEHMAYHDSLSGLPNRRLFEDRLKQGIIQAKRRGNKVAVLFIDLDRFKYINDTFGHTYGDKLIQRVASRISGCLREVDTLSRQGGDEYSIMLDCIQSDQDVLTVVHRIQEELCQPFMIDQRDLHITVSIGIALYPDHGESVESLIQYADMAMYRAKEEGKNHHSFFNDDLSALLIKKLDLETGLRKAIEREELSLYYQPQFAITTGELIGVEALIRWKREGAGMVSPGEFIPIAEETGLIIAIGEWIIRTACHQAKAWQDKGYPPLKMSVNLSSLQFQQDELIPMIRNALSESHLEARYLDIEITESIAMNDVVQVTDKLQQLKSLGIQLSMDDFGTGFSSLSYLKKFPIDTLKIDQSFVRDISVDEDSKKIVSAILAMAFSLDMNVIAEGVETYEQLQFLRSYGCHEAQGYLFSKPIPSDQLQLLLEQVKAGDYKAY
jgi:diguanylate cyclase